MSDRYAGSNISRRIGNQTGGFNQKSTQVYAQNPGDNKLAARIASYELAARMQLSVPEISDMVIKN